MMYNDMPGTRYGSDQDEQTYTLLIVDDEPANLLLLDATLASQYRVLAANNGERALKLAAGEPRPDLILLDVMMPGSSGFDVLRQLRANESTQDIPVIFLTVQQDDEIELQALELGAVDYLHKPIKPLLVLARVRTQLEAKAARELLHKLNQRLNHRVDEGAHALEIAQQQLLQADKMSSLGQLSASIAHEINTPVAYVSSNLGTLDTYLSDLFAIIGGCAADESSPFQAILASHDYAFLKQDVPQLLAESKEGLRRVQQIAQDLRIFSHAGAIELQWVDLHQCLDSTLNIVRHELKNHCTVTKHYGALPPVCCHSSQLNQVFMNLLVNAAQAIKGNGEITITTESVADKEVCVRITDTGDGIAPEHLEHVFDPFFTTKPVGQGTGLGLSLAWNIVARHQGRIEVTSLQGRGTTVTVTLPVHQAEKTPDEVGGR